MALRKSLSKALWIVAVKKEAEDDLVEALEKFNKAHADAGPKVADIQHLVRQHAPNAHPALCNWPGT